MVEIELTDLPKTGRGKGEGVQCSAPSPTPTAPTALNTTAVGILHGVAPLFRKNPVLSFPIVRALF